MTDETIAHDRKHDDPRVPAETSPVHIPPATIRLGWHARQQKDAGSGC
jgi:hypothetical protein